MNIRSGNLSWCLLKITFIDVAYGLSNIVLTKEKLCAFKIFGIPYSNKSSNYRALSTISCSGSIYL